MAGLGDWIQKFLFNTTFKDIIESIDGVKSRIEELDRKLEREVGQLQKQLEETGADSSRRKSP